MPHWKLTIAYDGTGFHGWQVQPGLTTVQGTLGEALQRVTGETVQPQASGRTDTGVHALGQVVSFSLSVDLPRENLHRALNNLLPPSIRVLNLEPVAASFHARFGSLRKTYEYRIFERRETPDRSPRVCMPFVAPYVWDCHWPLDLEAMEVATRAILGEHDFTSFAAADPSRKNSFDGESTGVFDPAIPQGNVRTVYSAAWRRTPELLTFRITGSGFLHNMVRNLVGTLVDVGRGFTPAEAMGEMLAARDRSAAGPTAPARGLFLVSVEYPGEAL